MLRTLAQMRSAEVAGVTQHTACIGRKPQFDLVHPACMQRGEVEVKPPAVPRVEYLPHGVCPMRSGKDPVLPPGPPLRTKRASFPAFRSSLSKPRRRSRFNHGELSATRDPVAVRMQHQQIATRVRATIDHPFQME
jgi:hypothetical protein